MLSQLTGGELRPHLYLPRFGANRFLAAWIGAATLAVLLIGSAGAQAQAQSQTAQQPATSSSQISTQQAQTLERSYRNRRVQTKQKREAEAVTDTYTHRWEVYFGGQYMRFRPGPALHNSGMGGWTLELTRYFSPRWGIVGDAQGYYGNNSLGATGGPYNTYNAKFSVYPFTIGPQYRFYGTPRISISGAVQAGIIYGYFDQNTGPFPPPLVGLYPASVVGAANANLKFDYNLSPALAIRIAPNVLFDHFGGNTDHNQGFLMGMVYRFGRQ